MPKNLWIKSRYTNFSSKENVFQKVFDWFFSLDSYLQISIISILLIAVAAQAFVSQKNLSIFGHASSNKTAVISIAPASNSYVVGQQFVVNLVIDGGGQAFNAAQASVSIPSNLTIQNLTITPPASGGCNFTFVTTKFTPTITDPSFAGAVLNGSVQQSCILYSMVLQGNVAGIGTITISRGSVKAYANSGEIILSTQNGVYTIGSAITPTPTPIIPTPTVVVPPTAFPTPTPIPTIAPTVTQVVAPPTFDSQPTDTYQTTVNITGTSGSGLSVFLNNTTAGITYPTTTTWQYSALLTQGLNTFTAYAQDATGNKSANIALSITLHRLGDINGDGAIDLTDLSMFATDWANTGTFNYALSDMNSDGIIDLTDFSILAKAYGN